MNALLLALDSTGVRCFLGGGVQLLLAIRCRKQLTHRTIGGSPHVTITGVRVKQPSSLASQSVLIVDAIGR